MMRKTGGTAKTSVEMSCRRSGPFERVGWRRYGKPWRALEAEAQAAAEQAEAEGGKHPGVPDDKAQRNFTDTESRIIPAPGGKDFLQAYNCQAVVDSAHQVIVAARATNQTSDTQQAAAMMEETIDNVGAVPREVSADAGYYSAKAVDELYALGVDPFVAPGADPPRPGCAHPRPEVAYPTICLPGIGCDGSYRPGGVGSATLCGCKLWSRYSARSSRAGDSGSSCCGGLEKVNGEWSLICTGTTCSNCSALGSICTGKHGAMGQPTHQELCRGS